MTKERDQSFVIKSLERTTVSTVKKRKQATRFIKYSKVAYIRGQGAGPIKPKLQLTNKGREQYVVNPFVHNVSFGVSTLLYMYTFFGHPLICRATMASRNNKC